MQCKTCPHYAESTLHAEQGRCLRHAPAARVTNEGSGTRRFSARWVPVESFDRCGEHPEALRVTALIGVEVVRDFAADEAARRAAERALRPKVKRYRSTITRAFRRLVHAVKNRHDTGGIAALSSALDEAEKQVGEVDPAEPPNPPRPIPDVAVEGEE